MSLSNLLFKNTEFRSVGVPSRVLNYADLISEEDEEMYSPKWIGMVGQKMDGICRNKVVSYFDWESYADQVMKIDYVYNTDLIKTGNLSTSIIGAGYNTGPYHNWALVKSDSKLKAMRAQGCTEITIAVLSFQSKLNVLWYKGLYVIPINDVFHMPTCNIKGEKIRGIPLSEGEFEECHESFKQYIYQFSK